MIGSAALGLGALLLAQCPGRRAVAATWGVSVLSLMTSGMAIPMLLWLGAHTVLRDGLRRALTLTLPPLVVYAAWWLGWGRDAQTAIPPSRLPDVIPLAWRGLAGTWEQMTGFAGAGPVIVVGLLVAALVMHVDTDRRALAMSGIAAGLAAYLVLAHSRGGLGPEATAASRYAYFGALMTLPALALVLHELGERLVRRPIERSLTLAVILALLVVPGVIGVVEFRQARDSLTPDLRGRLAAGVELVRSDEALLSAVLDPTYNPDITADALRTDEVADALPDGPVTARNRLTARAALQVGTWPTTMGLSPARPEIVGTTSTEVVGTTSTESGECRIGVGAEGSTVEVPAGPDGSQFRLILSGVDRTSVRLREDGLTSLPVALPVEDGTEAYVGVAAPDVTLVVDLPAGSPFTVCGVPTG